MKGADCDATTLHPNMPFSEIFDPELAKLIAAAIHEACQKLCFANSYDGIHPRTVMALELTQP